MHTTLTLPRPTKEEKQTLADFTRDGVISALWHRGLDTNRIARATRLKESDVYNRLAALREAGKL
jgi:hypothetical protein